MYGRHRKQSYVKEALATKNALKTVLKRNCLTRPQSDTYPIALLYLFIQCGCFTVRKGLDT